MLVRDQEKFGVRRRALREIIYALVIGGLPTVLSSATITTLSDMVKTLLTAPFLMGYYAAILVVLALVTIINFQIRFGASNHRRAMRALHAFFVNIGGSLLTACRAALGAMIGFLVVWAWADPGAMSVVRIFSTASYASMTLCVCVMLAWMEEALRNPHTISRYS